MNIFHLAILMDSYYSGSWCYKLENTKKNLNIKIYASCKRDETAKDCQGGICLMVVNQKLNLIIVSL